MELALLVRGERVVRFQSGEEDPPMGGVDAEPEPELRDGVRDRLEGCRADGLGVLADLDREIDEGHDDRDPAEELADVGQVLQSHALGLPARLRPEPPPRRSRSVTA